MQTFLPYESFQQSLECLDRQRLGKQRLEAKQLIGVIRRKKHQNNLHTGTIAWANHPACLMWENYLPALQMYYNTSIIVWQARGYKNTMELEKPSPFFKRPFWLGNPAFHSSHRANLLRKNYYHYSKLGWKEDPELPYIWPVTKDNANTLVSRLVRLAPQ